MCRDSITLLLNSETRSSTSDVTEFWLLFLSYVEFVDEPPMSAELGQYISKLQMRMPTASMPDYTPLDAIRVALWKSATGDSNVAWGDICKTFLVMNFGQDDPSTTVNALLKGSSIKPLNVGFEIGMQVARHLMGVRNSPSEHEETLVALLTTYLAINTEKLVAVFERHEHESVVR